MPCTTNCIRIISINGCGVFKTFAQVAASILLKVALGNNFYLSGFGAKGAFVAANF